MASFDLTAQLQLQAPTNTNAVIGQIRRQLQGISVPIDIQANTQALSQASTQINNVAKSSKRASTEVEKFQKSLRSAINRFGAFAIGTRIIGGITSSLSRATTEAIKFEETFVKISQITGKNVGELSSLRNTITSLSTGLGVASSELLTVAKTLTQAGFSAQNTERALSVLAKTTLGSSFDDIINTTEGAIAVLNQFASQAAAAGDQVKFLETTLGAINAVSKRFAVEANDIVSAVRRVGGVFSSAGGSVEELIALFTSVRATTRESAETIATGLRTIFTRLQRDDTVDRLKQLGIELRTAEGLFVGPYQAIERLARGLAGLDPRDFRFSEIVEELGGIRQIGKLIPLIQANVKAQQALNVARAGGDSINEDAEKTQGLLARRIRETSQSFNELVRKITESEGFKELANFGLAFANSLIQITDAITPLIPLLTKMIGTVLLLKGIKLGGSALGIGGLLKRNSGGKIYKFARGGFVPGSGNTDSVPAMLQPGEFVIKKSSAESLGASTLNAMNNNRFNKGGEQEKLSNKLAGKGVSGSFTLAGQKEAKIDAKAVIRAAGDKDGDNELDIGAAFMQPVGINRKTQAAIDSKPFYAAIKKDLGGSSQGKGGGVTDAAIKRSIGDLGNQVKIGITSGSLSQGTSTAFRGGLKNAIAQYSARFAKAEISKLPFNTGKFSRAYKKSNVGQIEGGVFEAFVNGLSDAPFDEAKIRANDKFDFPSGLGASGSLFNVAGYMPSDAKRTFNEESLVSLASKGSRYLVEGFRSEFAKSLQKNNTAVAGTPIEASRLKAQQESAGRTSRLKPPQNRHFGGLIQKFEEGGEAGSISKTIRVHSKPIKTIPNSGRFTTPSSIKLRKPGARKVQSL
jgi:TP901 family phage tail tape measure protein